MSAEHVLNDQQFTREKLRGDVRLGIVAQQGRAEAAGLGHRTETRTFYGGKHTAVGENVENRLTIAQADTEHARRRSADREEAAGHVPMSDAEREDLHDQLKKNGW